MTTALRRDPLALPRPQLWRVTDRTAFEALRREGHRARRGPLTVTWLPSASSGRVEHPRVAFAIGRSVGNAVVRNRIRRRLRAGLRDLQTRGCLPAGSYLVSGSVELARQPWSDLVSALDGAVSAATSGTTSR